MNGQPDVFPPRGRFGDGGFFAHAHHGGGPHALGWAIFALALALLLLSAATFALVLAAHLRTRQWRGGAAWRRGFGGGPPPVAILGKRYARGEIGRDEFVRALDDLRGAAPPPPAASDEAPTAE